MKGFAKRAVLRLSAKELRTELYWAPPFTACRATKGFYGETTKRATEVSVFSRQRSREGLMGLGGPMRSELAQLYVLGWWTRTSSSVVVFPQGHHPVSPGTEHVAYGTQGQMPEHGNPS